MPGSRGAAIAGARFVKHDHSQKDAARRCALTIIAPHCASLAVRCLPASTCSKAVLQAVRGVKS